eukprot:COSAG05_NODE_13780_length_418_cov_0.808777_2_plen_21_part_01
MNAVVLKPTKVMFSTVTTNAY